LNKYFLYYFILAVLLFCETANTISAHDIVFPSAPFSGDSSENYCNFLAQRGDMLWQDEKSESYRKAYDTLRLLVEYCPLKKDIAKFQFAWKVFSEIGMCVYSMDTINSRWIEYREWLKRVLYLNPDTMYYCSDADEMISTLAYLEPGKGIDYNGAIAIIDYILNESRCPLFTKMFLERRQNIRKDQILAWGHGDTTKPLDTSATSIDSIGFSILKGPQFGAVKERPIESVNLGELRASKNPFTDETTLETTISDAMMLRLEVFDVLGKQLYSENEFFSSGDVRWKLEGKLLPKGPLYARVSTIGGVVRTVKLIKE
jgi:hypothetical protein